MSTPSRSRLDSSCRVIRSRERPRSAPAAIGLNVFVTITGRLPRPAIHLPIHSSLRPPPPPSRGEPAPGAGALGFNLFGDDPGRAPGAGDPLPVPPLAAPPAVRVCRVEGAHPERPRRIHQLKRLLLGLALPEELGR